MQVSSDLWKLSVDGEEIDDLTISLFVRTTVNEQTVKNL